MNGRDYAALDEALVVLERYAPEYGGGLANHGPMAVEALSAMGRPESITSWVEKYRQSLRPRRKPGERIDGVRWHSALGDYSRVSDWGAFFEDELRDRSWREELRLWLPRLTPGIIAAATHGPIRVSHAARALEQEETDPRRRELAQALAYWAATYATLPEKASPVPAPPMRPSLALRTVPMLPRERRGSVRLITEGLDRLREFPPFAETAALADTDVDPGDFISDLTAAFARVYLANAADIFSTIVFVHSITGPASLRLMLPYLTADQRKEALRYAWQAAAALFSVYAAKPGVDGTVDAAGLTRASLIDEAVQSGDEHAIKLTEVCLREHALNPRPEYLAAARHACSALRQ